MLLAGCAVRTRGPLRSTSAPELVEALAARRAAVTSLRARARLRAGIGSAWVHEALLVRRPDAVRVDVLTPFGLALALGAKGTLLWAFPPSERTRYEGLATPENLARFLGAPIHVSDVVDILLGVPPGRTASGPPALGVTRTGEYQLTIPVGDGSQTVWFAGDTLTVLRAEERLASGVTLQLTFGDYRDGFPRALRIATPGRAAVELIYDTVEPNAQIATDLFVPPAAARVLPLDAAGAPSDVTVAQ